MPKCDLSEICDLVFYLDTRQNLELEGLIHTAKKVPEIMSHMLRGELEKDRKQHSIKCGS